MNYKILFYSLYLKNVSGMLKINHTKIQIYLQQENLSDINAPKQVCNVSLTINKGVYLTWYKTSLLSLTKYQNVERLSNNGLIVPV